MSSDEILDVDTPEQMQIEFPLAGIGSRFLALLLDTIAQIALSVVFALGLVALGGALGGVGSHGAIWVIAVLTLLQFIVQFAYFAGFEAMWNGQTPGKRRLGLRVIKTNGRPIVPADAVARNFMRIIDELPGVYGVGIVCAMISPRRQRLGDLVAGTVVVHEQALVLGALGLDQRASSAGIRAGRPRLTAEELIVVESFLVRRNEIELEGATRRRLADQLAARIASRTHTPAEERPDSEAWLESLALESRQLAERS